MRGLMGRLEVGGVSVRDEDLAVVLKLGETCHIGADVAFGCGRYALEFIQTG